MNPAALATEASDTLRQRAQSQMQAGLSQRPARSPAEALAVLYRLAGAPSTAGDALALLHELQVHQVELELQQEELLRNQVELQQALQRQTLRLEQAQVGCLSLDAAGKITELNSAAAHLLGAAPASMVGRSLSGLLTPLGAQALQALLQDLGPQQADMNGPARPKVCALELSAGPRPATQILLASAAADQRPGQWLLGLMASPDSH